MAELSLKQYKSVVLVADLRSFTLASHKMHVTVPALSKTIKEAEDILGFSLFERSPKNVSITTKGGYFLEGARNVVQAHDTAMENARLIQDDKRGALRIAGTQLANATFLFKAASLYEQQNPAIKINVFDNDAETLQDQLEQGAFDMAIGPRRHTSEALETIDICTVPMYFVSPKCGDTPAESVRWADVVHRKLLFPDSKAALHVIHYLDGRYALDDWSVVGSSTTALAMVENDRGCMVSAYYSRKLAHAYDVQCQRLVDPEVGMTLSLYVRKNRNDGRLVRDACAALASIIRKIVSPADDSGSTS